MIFHESVPDVDQRRIKQALDDIKFYGDNFQQKIAEFIKSTKLTIHLDIAAKVHGSGSVELDNSFIRKQRKNQRQSKGNPLASEK